MNSEYLQHPNSTVPRKTLAPINEDEDLEPPQQVAAELYLLDRRSLRARIIAAVLAALGLAVAVWGIFQFPSTAAGLDQLGSFFAGTVTAVLSLAGLLLVYVAFLGQRYQLLQQEEELRQNRIEMRATTREISGQRQ